MDCQDCPHDKSVQLTKIVSGKLTKATVCSDCPLRSPLDGPVEQEGFSLVAFLASIKSAQEAPPEPGAPVSASLPQLDLTCPTCDDTFETFRTTGRLGCHDCYQVFGSALTPLLKKIHKATRHVGKIPTRAATRLDLIARLDDLRSQLASAVREERYEDAARFRDEIQEAQAALGERRGREEE